MVDKRVEEIVNHLVKLFEKENKRKPSFEELVKDCIYLKGINTANYLFESLKDGWIANGFKPTNFKAVNKTLFPFDRDYYYTELETFLNQEHQANINAHHKQSRK